tara:strand:- start:399 stop:941 length:543 start_codon:yes stop_codon:yes gene_type:complete
MDTLDKQKYKYVKNMLSPEMVEFLTTYSIRKAASGTNRPDEQVNLSTSFHSSESDVYNHIIHYLHPLMEIQSGLSLKPIYSFNRIYFPGSDLKIHKDRPACEISASITLKYLYQDPSYKWPLCMGDKPVIINQGDGVIYKGCEIDHWRPVFNQPKDSWHHQLFIHYVDANGPYKDIEEEL